MRRIDHKLVKYRPNKGWQLPATNADGCRYTSARLPPLSPSLFSLQIPTSLSYTHTHTHQIYLLQRPNGLIEQVVVVFFFMAKKFGRS